MERAAGLLLHPTSLPGPDGIGALGAEAYRMIDTLVEAGLRLWQVLPLGPTGYGDSPYAALSAFAGNPLLVSLVTLTQMNLLTDDDVVDVPNDPLQVDFGRVIPAKMDVLRRAAGRFTETEAFARFVEAERGWLEDFALFMALKEEHNAIPWWEWPAPLRSRDAGALAQARLRLAPHLQFHRIVQYLFFSQWLRLRRYANERGIRIIGDMPIFVAEDSCDVWSHQHLFLLDEAGRPTFVAGVPPDYFSATGQLWGNPLYRWERLRQTGYRWWIDRFRALFRLVDIVRIDHFRGFAAAWHVPAGESTAVNGEWVPGPGADLFSAVLEALGPVPIIVEDLGVITPDVVALREQFGFPGMHILQFAFGSGSRNESLPHNLPHNAAVYTGTHDNDTTVGWYHAEPPEVQAQVRAYTGNQALDVAWDFIRMAIASVCDIAAFPLQDVLRLGTSARMNYPGRLGGNWSWRYTRDAITEEHVAGLRELCETYGRIEGDSAPEAAHGAG